MAIKIKKKCFHIYNLEYQAYLVSESNANVRSGYSGMLINAVAAYDTYAEASDKCNELDISNAIVTSNNTTKDHQFLFLNDGVAIRGSFTRDYLEADGFVISDLTIAEATTTQEAAVKLKNFIETFGALHLIPSEIDVDSLP